MSNLWLGVFCPENQEDGEDCGDHAGHLDGPEAAVAVEDGQDHRGEGVARELDDVVQGRHGVAQRR